MDKEYLNEIKIVIKGIVRSNPPEKLMTLKKLEDDFKECEGYQIPYFNFGYNCLKYFLESIPDAVILKNNNNLITIHAVSSENTEHIDEMVGRQRKPRQRNRARHKHNHQTYFSNGINYLNPSNYSYNTNYFNNTNIYTNQPIKYNSGYPGYHQVTSRNLVPVPPIMVPMPVNYYPSIPYNYNTNMYNNNLKLMEFQRNKESKEFKTYQYYPGNILELSKTTKTRNNDFGALKNTDGRKTEQIKDQYLMNSFSNLVPTKSSFNIPKLDKNIEKNNGQVETNQNAQLKEDFLEIKTIEQNCSTKAKNGSKEKSFISDSRESSNVISNPNFNKFNSEIGNERENLYHGKELNESSVHSTIFSSNDVSPLDELSESNENVLKIKNLNLDDSRKFVFPKKKKNLNKCNTKIFNKLNSISENFENDPNIDEKFNKIKDNQIKKEPAIPKLDYNDILFTFDFPKVENGIATEIPPVEIPHHFKKGAIVKLFVSEVHNPYRFWFNYASQTNIHPLDVLMNEMEKYYCNLDSPNELKMLKCHICPGSVGVALYANQWHRVEILELASMDSSVVDEVKVFYVDYGTVSECKIEQLKYLLKKFGELPRQAMRGTMALIRPIGSWSRDAIRRFIEEVSDVLVQAKITYLEEDRKICHLKMLKQFDEEIEFTFGSENSIVDINNLMCDAWDINGQRFATFGPLMENSIHKQHYNHEEHRFPTFELLEKGKYPTYGQIMHIQALTGVDIETKLFWRSQLENLDVPLRYE